MDVSIVLTCHAEGLLIHRTMRAIERLRGFAGEQGLTSEVIAVMDSPAPATAGYAAAHFPKDYRVHTVSYSDPGLARDYGADQARGRYVAFHGADGLYSKNWLVECCRLADSKPHRRFVLHAEYSVRFGAGADQLQRRFSFDQPGFHPRAFFDFDPYDASAFAPHEVFAEHRYGAGGSGRHWNLSTLAAGYEHHAAANTALFVRAKAGRPPRSGEGEDGAELERTPFFDSAVYRRLFEGAPEAPGGTGWARFRKACLVALEGVIRWVRRNRKKRRGYYFNYEIDELLRSAVPRMKSLLDPVRSLGPGGPKPDWLAAEMREINRIDPEISVTDASLRRMRQSMVPKTSIAGEMYYEICRELEGPYDHVFLGPWLRAGGADLVTLNYVRVLLSERIAKDVLLILTEDASSDWLDRLPKGVRVLQFGRRFGYLSGAIQQKLLLRVLLQFGCARLHIINSKLGFETVASYGELLSRHMRIYPHAFSCERDEFGNYRGFSFVEQNRIYPFVTQVLTDNNAIIDFLVGMYAYDRSKFQCIYQPVAKIEQTCPAAEGRILRLLWAGRFDREKRPHLLVKIAKRLGELDPSIRIDVYGRGVLDGSFSEREFDGAENLTYRGEYDGWESLDARGYDAFLHTSEFDGMPNVVLEALSSGLIVVAPRQGGLPEIIEDGVNGFLVPTEDDVEPYAEAVMKVRRDRTLKPRFFEVTRGKLEARHSSRAFAERLAALGSFANEP